MGRIAFQKELGVLAFLCLAALSSRALADPGVDWLRDRVQPDGRYASAGDLATAVQSTAETLRAFHALAVTPTDIETSRAYVDGAVFDGTEYLARRIILRADAGGDTAASSAELLARQSRNGGFGDGAGFDSSVLDTAFALEALGEAGTPAPQPIGRAVRYLLDRQRADGGYAATGNASSIYLTAQVVRGLHPYRHRLDLGDALPAAREYLLSQRTASGAIGEPFETAAALLAVAPVAVDPSRYQDAVQHLSDAQRADGSWEGDVFTTALALRALALASRPQPNPDLGTIRARVVNGETGVPIAGASVTLSGAGGAVASTDGEGRFVFSGLVSGDYEIRVAATDFEPVVAGIGLNPGEEKDLGTIRMLGVLDPTLSALQGTVTDAATGTAIAGATVTVSSAAGASTQTSADGSYRLERLEPGVVTVSVSRADYESASASLTLEAGAAAVLSVALQPVTEPQFALSGTIASSTTGNPIQGATVTISGAADASATTDAAGAYAIDGLIPGDVIFTVTASGFQSASTSTTTQDGQRLVFSPALAPEGAPEPTPDAAAITGRTVDRATGAALGGVEVTARVSGISLTVTSDADGRFALGDLPSGEAEMEFAKPDYTTVTRTLTLAENITVDTGDVVLTPSDFYPPATATGVVVDSTTDEPLAGVSIEATFAGGTSTLATDANGAFEVDGLGEIEGRLRFTHDGYLTVTLPVFLIGETTDLGQIRMRPEGLGDLRPDLVPETVDGSGASTDPDTLALTGRVTGRIVNEGLGPAGAPFELLAFYDADGDGAFTEANDPVLGRAPRESELGAGNAADAAVDVSGELPFRDAPVSIWVDSGERVVEREEGNNVTVAACRIEPAPAADLALALKWHWVGPGGDPSAGNVHGPVAVGQLSDDNGDGVIDASDTPDLVFQAGGRSNASGRTLLTVVSGETGRELWRRGDLRVTHKGSVALGDIDGDGIAEIVAVNGNRSAIMALEHDGTLKWTAPSGPQEWRSWVADGPSIADLDGDGSPEIVQGNRVYGADGSLRWIGALDVGSRIRRMRFGMVSVPVDIDLDGLLEVSAGRTLYDTDGSIVWHVSEAGGDGYTAFGNFDNDDYPEIVLASRGRLYLIDETGSVLWQVSIPTTSYGGPPTVGDFDGDGAPEIGVAGARYYAVYEGDGSLRWSRPIQDTTSEVTGSSLFDFDDDGRVEVLYADERHFWIFDGASGEVLSRIRNSSITKLEYPVVADVDGDGAAEIVVTANQYSADIRGVRVFEAEAGNWAPTRALWNQHAYHIDNINDDGTVPRRPAHSWLTHNTFRLNTFPDRDPLVTSDLTASLLEVVDHGAGEPLGLRVRVGNGGAAPTPSGVVATFYDGDPGAGGGALGSLAIEPLEPGEHRDLELTGVDAAALSGADLHVRVDATDRARECDETNNADHTPATAPALIGRVSVATGADAYPPNGPVSIEAAGINTSTFSGPFTLALRIEDAAGARVADLGTFDLGALASGERAAITTDWNTGGILSGAYDVRAVLLAGDGAVVDEAATPLAILVAEGDPTVTLRTATDRAIYNVTDTVRIENLARNHTVSTSVGDATLALRVLDPGGATVLSETRSLGDLGPGALREPVIDHVLDRAQSGTYTVSGMILDAGGAAIASDTAAFTVVEDLAESLAGAVTARFDERVQGEAQVCEDTLTYSGTQALSGLPVRRLVVDLDNGEVEERTESTLALAPGETDTQVRSIATGGLAVGGHACILQARIEGAWRTLAHDSFRVLEPPIDIDATLSLGQRGRVLVLLDPAPPNGPEDPHGPDGVPSPAEQRAHLEGLLEREGWDYTIVTGAEAFTRELRSGAYEAYALLDEQVKLTERTQKELREAVFRGEALLVAGGHDARNGRIAPALGVEVRGKHPNADGVELLDSPLGGAGEVALRAGEKPLVVTPAGASVAARYALVAQPSGHRPDVAVTTHAYGEGRSVLAGFDLLAQAAAAGEGGAYDELIAGALDWTHPEPLRPWADSVRSVMLTLVNEGIATRGRVILTLPEGMGVYDPGAAQVTEDGALVWTFELAEDETERLTLWLRLPAAPGPAAVQAEILTGVAPDLVPHDTVSLALTVEGRAPLTEAIALAREAGLRRVARDLERADAELARGRHEQALKALLRATDELERSDHAEADTIRLTVGHAVRRVERLIFQAAPSG